MKPVIHCCVTFTLNDIHIEFLIFVEKWLRSILSTAGPEGTPPACGTSSGQYRRMSPVSYPEPGFSFETVFSIFQVRLSRVRLVGGHHLRSVLMGLWSTASWPLEASLTGGSWWTLWGEKLGEGIVEIMQMLDTIYVTLDLNFRDVSKGAEPRRVVKSVIL